jgi:hypothetical protein
MPENHSLFASRTLQNACAVIAKSKTAIERDFQASYVFRKIQKNLNDCTAKI